MIESVCFNDAKKIIFFISRVQFSYHKYLFPYSAGIDFRRQNLTSIDVRL